MTRFSFEDKRRLVKKIDTLPRESHLEIYFFILKEMMNKKKISKEKKISKVKLKKAVSELKKERKQDILAFNSSFSGNKPWQPITPTLTPGSTPIAALSTKKETPIALKIEHVRIQEKSNFPKNNPSEEKNTSDVKARLIDVMCEFADANRRKEWPTNISIACRWDAHPFSGPPVSIPRWYIKGVFYVMDNYCSWSCAAAHLFERNDLDESEKWECYSLLHLLRKKVTKKNTLEKIKLAPKLNILKIYGGPYDIREYRSLTKETNLNHKVYKINYPPMVSIVPKIEEKNYSKEDNILDTLSKKNAKMKYVAARNEHYFERTRWGLSNQPFIPVDTEKVKRATQNLRIKRNKPLVNKRQTLLHYIKND